MKKILIIAASVLCSAAVYVGVNSYANNSQMDLLTQNIEALTRGENPENIRCDSYFNETCIIVNDLKISGRRYTR